MNASINTPELSVVIPVYNEEQGLTALFERLYAALDALRIGYEVIFIDDGSRDRSVALLRQQFERRPEVTGVIVFNTNYGQHLAIMAGFERAHGARVVTLDADLQNPPEEIGKLLAKMDEGYDYVGGVRLERKDTWFRRSASRLLNALRERTTRIRMTDQGCMLRAYSRAIVDAVNQCREINTFVPALAYTFAANPTEIEVDHAERVAGETKYSLYRLMRLNFDLVTGFSLAPLRIISFLGVSLGIVSIAVIIVQSLRRIFLGPSAEGVFDSNMDALELLVSGVILMGIGLLGEYIGRIYQQVLRRPRYLISAVLESKVDAEAHVRVEPGDRTSRRIG